MLDCHLQSRTKHYPTVGFDINGLRVDDDAWS